MSDIWLEDLHVGDRHRTGEYVVTQEEVIAFARQYDPQPFHTDAVAAQDSFFQGLSASGWHTAGITMRLFVATMTFGKGSVGVEINLRWPSPTRPGDVLHVELEVTDVRRSRSKPDRGIVTLAYDTLNQRGEVRQHTVAKALVFARS